MSEQYVPTESGLLVPTSLRRNVQMAKPIVFWYDRQHDFIILPPSPVAPAPKGFEKIECIHAHDADTWSERLRAQEDRIRNMTDEERYNFEEPIRAAMLAELKENYRKAKDQVNREFLARSIALIETRREKQRKVVTETYMHFEASEGVAS